MTLTVDLFEQKIFTPATPSVEIVHTDFVIFLRFFFVYELRGLRDKQTDGQDQ